MTLSRFGFRVLIARTAKGLTQRELVEKTGITRATISKYENYTDAQSRGPSLDTIIKLAKVLCVSVDWLVGLSNENGVKL